MNYQKLRDERVDRQKINIFISPQFPIVSLDGTMVLIECFQWTLLQGLRIASSHPEDMLLGLKYPWGHVPDSGGSYGATRIQKNMVLENRIEGAWKEGKFLCHVFLEDDFARKSEETTVKGKFYFISRR